MTLPGPCSCHADHLSGALPPPCCAAKGVHARWTLTNPGTTTLTHTTAIARCSNCGQGRDSDDWQITLLARRRDERGDIQGGQEDTPPTERRRPTHAINQLYTQACQLIAAGWSVNAACREVGIDRHTYYDRTKPGHREKRTRAHQATPHAT